MKALAKLAMTALKNQGFVRMEPSEFCQDGVEWFINRNIILSIPSLSQGVTHSPRLMPVVCVDEQLGAEPTDDGESITLCLQMEDAEGEGYFPGPDVVVTKSTKEILLQCSPFLSINGIENFFAIRL